MTTDEAIQKHFPEGAVNTKLKGGGNGKIQYEYEKKVMRQMLNDYCHDKDKRIKELEQRLVNTVLEKESEKQGAYEIGYQECAEQKDQRIKELEEQIRIMSKSLATYGEHPIIEGQVQHLLNK